MKDKSNNTSRTIFDMVKGIVISELLALGLYICASIPINLFIYHEDYQSERDFTPVYFIMLFIYVIANYLVYIRKNVANGEIGKESEKFDLRSDIVSYIRGDGKYLFAIYGVMATVSEVLLLLRSGAPVLFVFNFPLTAVIGVPVIRTVVAYVCLMALIMCAVEYARYKSFRYWHDPNSVR